ncbi:hypothetical protein CEXT_711831 [Caerostris extrusa]|uniref:Uncharacterized protein n=1 Tax=Caerostris extrusa TaxID=172846 RepID=A0AAV4SYY8_CAEEX|nr:hypothetical protein CEXT_711831 [Caerostris extrusa]
MANKTPTTLCTLSIGTVITRFDRKFRRPQVLLLHVRGTSPILCGVRKIDLRTTKQTRLIYAAFLPTLDSLQGCDEKIIRYFCSLLSCSTCRTKERS